MKRYLAVLLCVCLCQVALPCARAEDAADEALTCEAVVEALRGDDAALDALYAHFTDDMSAAVPRSSLNGLWSQLERSCGAYAGMLEDAAVTEKQPYTVLTRTAAMAQLNLTVTLVLDEAGRVAGLQFTPAAKAAQPTAPPRDGISVEEVQVGEAPWVLPGTLTVPASAEPVPAVVLVHGSGPNDRDETVGATHLFADLAEALGAQGIAVLRYDKRTLVYGAEIAQSPDYATLTVEEETIQDAIAAARLLQADDRIDSDRIYLLGHSLGAMLAPRIAAESEGAFRGLVLACGTNRSLAEILRRQTLDAYANAGMDEEQLQTLATVFDEEMTMLEGLDASGAAEAETTLLIPAYYFWEMEQHPTAAEYLVQLALPTLLIGGERDFQVTPQEGRETWAEVLDLENTPWLTVLWADVNHLLMRPEAGEMAGTAAEYQLPCTLDEGVADAVAAFILTNGGNDQ